MNIAIIGSGVYGKAMAHLLKENGNNVIIWTEKTDGSVIPPEGVKVTNSYEEVMKDAEIVYVLTGSQFTPDIFKNIKKYITKGMIIILGSKGILSSGKLITDAFTSLMPKHAHLAVISGPTFAVDIAALEPLGFTLATKKKRDYNKVKKAMASINLEYSKDILGVEMCGSLKNAYAIGSGILGGFNYGNSIRCLYITKVLDEMKHIFKTVGAKEQTIITLAGVGDLVLTCTSLNSRNFTFGSILSLNDKKAKAKYLENNTVEGYENLKTYKRVFKEKGVSAPILFKVSDIVEGKVEANELIDILIKYEK